MMPKVMIVIPVRNQLEYLIKCLISVKQYACSGICEQTIVVVNDHSSKYTNQWLTYNQDRFMDLLLHNYDSPGFPNTANVGLNQAISAEFEYVVVLNSDTVVTTNWLNIMLDAMRIDDKIGIVGPSTSYCAGPQSQDLPYDASQYATQPDSNMVNTNYLFNDIEAMAAKMFDQFGSTYIESTLSGFCMLFRTAMLKEIGMFDTRFGLGSGEDSLLQYKAKKAGWLTIHSQGSYVHHYGHRTFGSEVGNSTKLWQSNNELCQKLKKEIDDGETEKAEKAETEA